MGRRSLRERDMEIFERVMGRESYQDVARSYGFTPENVGRIYRREWREHCEVASREKVRDKLGDDRFSSVGPMSSQKYKGEARLANGKVKTKLFTGTYSECREQWESWREYVQAGRESEYDGAVVPDEDDARVTCGHPDDPVEEVRPMAVAEVEPDAPEVEPEVEPAPAEDVWVMRRTDGGGQVVLFRDLDEALRVADRLRRLLDVEFDVAEGTFWEG